MAVKIKSIIEEFNLKVYNRGYEDTVITENELNRSGLQLAGYYGYFEEKRIQILGNAEISYLESLTDTERQKSCEGLLKYNIPCVIVTHSNPISNALLDAAKKFNRWLLHTDKATTNLTVDLTSYLQNALAASISFHGVLMDVFGVGVLITGQSGIGKSETALELIHRGHLIIADDSVVIRRPSPDMLIGTGAELTKNLMEIRGIGILDIKSLFGLKAIRVQKNIEIVIHLEPWDESVHYDRVGDRYQETEIMGVKLPYITVPVRPGRNLAIIVEVAALNYRQNILGYNAARELDEKIKRLSKGYA